MVRKNNLDYAALFSRRPNAVSVIKGSENYPNIKGVVKFYQTQKGTVVVTEVFGLPYSEEMCREGVFGFHIHSGNSCTGTAEDPFASARGHYDINNCKHPNHAGDLPPIFSSDGYAFSAVLTKRISVREIIGKTVIIHSSYDDFETQPGGNSGIKIACGVIRPYAVTR